MDPALFWRLTPGEFQEFVRGFRRREDREWERTAWLAANLMNIEGKSLKKGHSMSVDKLLGRTKKRSSIQLTDAD